MEFCVVSLHLGPASRQGPPLPGAQESSAGLRTVGACPQEPPPLAAKPWQKPSSQHQLGSAHMGESWAGAAEQNTSLNTFSLFSSLEETTVSLPLGTLTNVLNWLHHPPRRIVKEVHA